MYWYASLLLIIFLRVCSGREFAKDSGLTDKEAQKLLDYHNYYRAKQALGKIPGQPPAADMTALEWDDMLEKDAQPWASQCGAGMHDDAKTKGQGQCYVGYSSGAEGFMKYAFTSWCDKEWKGFNFERDNFLQGHGHYTQIVTAYTRKVGCGYNRCSRHRFSRIVCNFYPSGNLQDFHAWTKGPACTKCPFGRPYCMADALCVRKDQCKGSQSECKCSIDWNKCTRNGGKANKGKCHCECASGWTGANCDKECKDLQYCGFVKKDECLKAGKYLPFYTNKCPKHCESCRLIDLKSKENRRGLTINVLDSPDAVLAGKTKTGVDGGKPTDDQEDKTGGASGGGNGSGGGGSGGSSCTDIQITCVGWAQRGECEKNPGWMKKNCKKSCRQC